MSESVYKFYLDTFARAKTGGVVALGQDLTLEEAHAAAQGVFDGKASDRPQSRRDVEAQVTAALLMPEPAVGSAGSAS